MLTMALILLLGFSLASITSAATARTSVCPRSCDCNHAQTDALGNTILELNCFVWDIADFVAIPNIDIQEKFRLNLKCDSAVPSDIDSYMFSSLSNLMSIIFQECKISYIHKHAFRGMNNLEKIEIHSGSNFHLQIHPLAFDDLASLGTLVMRDSGILRIPNLCDLRELRILNISGNSLSSFKDAGLDCTSDWFLQSLMVLDISRNYFSSLKHLGQIGSLFPNLEIFSAMENEIQMGTDEEPFINFVKLRVLELSKNKISEIPNSLLASSHDFQEIRFSENKFKFVPSGFFHHCTRLLQLDLSGNSLDDTIWIELAELKNLMYLDISDNQLTFLNQTTIIELPGLTYLNLADNFISDIPVRTFQNQQHLVELSLAANKINTLENESIYGLLLLKKLELQANMIDKMAEHVLDSVPSLVLLNISHNFLLDMPSLNKLSSLHTLDASHNNIIELPEKEFIAQSKVEYINLSANNIREVSDDVFVTCSSLTKLDLSENYIRYLHPSVFMGLKLETLLLQTNHLNDIGKQFSSMDYLQELNLSDNRITDTIQKFMFPKNIEMLDLSHNMFENIRPYAFDGLGQIRIVDLRYNKISTISREALKISTGRYSQTGFRFEGNPLICDCNLLWLRQWNQATHGPTIVNLNITMCSGAYDFPSARLTSIPEDRFLCKYDNLCMESCKCCDFEACDCKYTCPENCECYNSADYVTNHHIKCSNKSISTIDKFIPKIGTMLDYSGNDVSVLESYSFIGMSYVNTLLLNNSRIETISNGSFVGLTRVQTLRLSNNLLTSLKHDMFRGLETVNELYLDNNRIYEIQDGVFSHMTSLKTLSLANNGLKVFTDYMSTLVFSINQISFHNNPWTCDCILYFSVRGKPESFVRSKRRRSSPYVRCMDNMSGQEIPLSKYSRKCEGHHFVTTTLSHFEELSSLEEEIVASDEQVDYLDNASVVVQETMEDKSIWTERMQIFIPAIAATTVVFIVVIGIMCRREFIKCVLFAKFKCKTSDLELLYDKMRYYDAFVTYHPSDEEFVLRELAIRLERGKPKYQLLLQQRDCPATSSIPNFISNSVQASHRTIIVLSSAYVADNSFLKCVTDSMKNDSIRRLIVITVGEIDSSKVDPVLRTYLQNKVSIKYGERWFWEKLQFSLPDPVKVERDIARAEARPYASSDLARFTKAMMDNEAYEEPFNGISRPLPTVNEYDYAAGEYNASQQSSNIYEEIRDTENTSVKYSEPWTDTQLRTNVETLTRNPET